MPDTRTNAGKKTGTAARGRSGVPDTESYIRSRLIQIVDACLEEPETLPAESATAAQPSQTEPLPAGASRAPAGKSAGKIAKKTAAPLPGRDLQTALKALELLAKYAGGPAPATQAPLRIQLVRFSPEASTTEQAGSQ